MEYTSRLFVDFLNKLIAFDKNSKSVLEAERSTIKNREENEEKEWDGLRIISSQHTESYKSKNQVILRDYQKQVDAVCIEDIKEKSDIFDRLQKCKESLQLVRSVENIIMNQDVYNANKSRTSKQATLSLEDILSGKIDFSSLAYELNSVLRLGKKREAEHKSSYFYSVCNMAEDMLNSEIERLHHLLVENKGFLDDKYLNIGVKSHQCVEEEWSAALKRLDNEARRFASQRVDGCSKTRKVISDMEKGRRDQLEKLTKEFVEQFSPKEFLDEYIRLYKLEPQYEHFECYHQMPRNVRIGTLEYDISELGFCEYIVSFLDKYYYFMFRNGKLCIPFSVSFGQEFNYMFKFNGEERQKIIKKACDLGMRLFMMLPPGKVNFTFIDPVTLGESFAMFTRLVDVDDRTSEIINGKIWSAPKDIEDKLKIMTDHISNVTQRCLQGKYNNIYEYNREAEQNAEPYKVIMLMDFPAGLTDQSLKLLEQIVTSGPKCGVFTIIYRNESQYQKISERSYPLVENIESSFQTFDFDNRGKFLCVGEVVKDKPFIWDSMKLPEVDAIIETIKKGIKNADKVVIDIEKVSEAESTDTTKEGIRIPIGIRGAKDVQYLTLGVGGSHHALIAGVAGSGKSSLLHTIILRALTQYSPDELSIYLVDFKRGVEFKIYADFVLPSFKVIAIESEREFGYNILTAIEREQKIRANIFRKNNVDKIEEYRDGQKKMPRVLVIMDEFHELFSNANDEFAKKSATIMERIVRQGRAFGIHMILASQSYSNITGIDRAVFDQMAVRVVLKCSKSDADLLLDNGSSEIEQISIDDPGRAVYNSEAGNREYNSHFRVAYIDPKKHESMLEEISKKTKSFAEEPTRILLSNIEDNKYSIYNQFVSYTEKDCPEQGRLYLGEPLGVTNNMTIDLTHDENSNMLMIGNDTEKARSMFTFAILSLCINYRIKHREGSTQPFIYLLNYKPFEDNEFPDTLQLLSDNLKSYIKSIPCGNMTDIKTVVTDLYDKVTKAEKDEVDRYFFVFGYQRAEELKSNVEPKQEEDILNFMSGDSSDKEKSIKEKFRTVIMQGSQKGVHSIIWHDSFKALDRDDRELPSYFALRIAFDMLPEEFSQFVGANDVALMSENNAIYYNKERDNQKFRPYQAPDKEWLTKIMDKLKEKLKEE